MTYFAYSFIILLFIRYQLPSMYILRELDVEKISVRDRRIKNQITSENLTFES